MADSKTDLHINAKELLLFINFEYCFVQIFIAQLLTLLSQTISQQYFVLINKVEEDHAS